MRKNKKIPIFLAIFDGKIKGIKKQRESTGFKGSINQFFDHFFVLIYKQIERYKKN